MKPLLLDKIASATYGLDLQREVRISQEIPCEEGVVLAVEVLTEKRVYDQLELTTGRMARLQKGDRVAGVLGHRQALFGYAGHLPEQLRPGDTVHLLNLGGVLGICEAVPPQLGPPFACRVLGTVLRFPYLGERIGVPARIGRIPFEAQSPLETRGVPVVAVVGTCMNSGKTAAACALSRCFRRRGLIVDAFKATGVALRRDILAMEDAGARHTLLFTDLGFTATTRANAPAVTRQLLTLLAREKPDLILIELGDGLLGAYGVDAILADEAIREALTVVVLAANDPVAAWGGVRLLREKYSLEPDAVTGPATDNAVGLEVLRRKLHVAGANALTQPEALGDLVTKALARKGVPV